MGGFMFQQNGTAVALQQDENSKEIALMEAKMQKLCDLLETRNTSNKKTEIHSFF